MRILISAYACEPGAGSEGGHGWNYPSELAKRGHEVHAIVPARCSEGVGRELARAPIDNLAFHFVGEREWPMRLGWTFGSALRYFLWQWDASQTALKLAATHDIEVIHHVSYGTLLGGSFMWRLGRPFVFGPAAADRRRRPRFSHTSAAFGALRPCAQFSRSTCGISIGRRSRPRGRRLSCSQPTVRLRFSRGAWEHDVSNPCLMSTFRTTLYRQRRPCACRANP